MNNSVIDIKEIASTMLARRKTYFKVWSVVFVLSCLWIFPQPRYYNCEVAIAPESADASVGGGLASLASSFGVNIGNMSSSDAIFPELYPDLFESNDFLVDFTYSQSVLQFVDKFTLTREASIVDAVSDFYPHTS